MNRSIPREQHTEEYFHKKRLAQGVKKRSDKLMNFFLGGFFAGGLLLAFYYDTWFVAIGVGGLSLLAYYLTKAALPDSNLYQYVLGAVLVVFKAQYIYQVHGLFEMHFIVFIGSALLVSYQNWKVQIPLVMTVAIHQLVFTFLQNAGYIELYFTGLDYIGLSSFAVHFILAGMIAVICGFWACQLEKYSEVQLTQTLEMAKLQKEAILSLQVKENEELLQRSNKELRRSNLALQKYVYRISNDFRGPGISAVGLVDVYEEATEEKFIVSESGIQKESITTLDLVINDPEDYLLSGRAEEIKEEINFKEMFEEITNNLSYLSGRKGMVEVNLNIRNEAPFVSDKQRVEMILNNLISNVINYQDPEVPKPFVYIKVHTYEAATSIVIRHNGIGLKEVMHEQTFEMLFRSTHTVEAPGFGLHIVKETIEKLNGRIQVESELEGGTEFNIHIPNYYKKVALA